MANKADNPDQSPQVFREHFKKMGIEYTLEDLWDFATKTLADEPVSDQTSKAAAAFIIELIQAAKYGEKWDSYKSVLGIRKITEKGFDPDQVTIDHPAMGLIMEYIEGQRTEKETLQLFNDHIYPASDGQIRRWIKAIRPRAEKTLNFINSIKGGH